VYEKCEKCQYQLQRTLVGIHCNQYYHNHSQTFRQDMKYKSLVLTLPGYSCLFIINMCIRCKICDIKEGSYLDDSQCIQRHLMQLHDPPHMVYIDEVYCSDTFLCDATKNVTQMANIQRGKVRYLVDTEYMWYRLLAVEKMNRYDIGHKKMNL
jgi:hypothetical protein